MLPVSSPTNASQTLWAEPSLPIGISLISLFDTTFAVTLTALDCGVNSPTFASTGVRCLFSPKPSTAKLIQHLVFFLELTEVFCMPHLSLLVPREPMQNHLQPVRRLKRPRFQYLCHRSLQCFGFVSVFLAEVVHNSGSAQEPDEMFCPCWNDVFVALSTHSWFT